MVSPVENRNEIINKMRLFNLTISKNLLIKKIWVNLIWFSLEIISWIIKTKSKKNVIYDYFDD